MNLVSFLSLPNQKRNDYCKSQVIWRHVLQTPLHLKDINFLKDCMETAYIEKKLSIRPSVTLSVQEKTVEVSDWRKNVEAMSGMEGRKKMFDAGSQWTDVSK